MEKVWKRLHTERTVQGKQHGGGNPSNLTQGDLQLIETWKKARPTSSLRGIHDVVNEFGYIPNETSISTICVCYTEKCPKKKNNKKNSTVAEERFTTDDMACTKMHVLPFALNLSIF